MCMEERQKDIVRGVNECWRILVSEAETIYRVPADVTQVQPDVLAVARRVVESLAEQMRITALPS